MKLFHLLLLVVFLLLPPALPADTPAGPATTPVSIGRISLADPTLASRLLPLFAPSTRAVGLEEPELGRLLASHADMTGEVHQAYDLILDGQGYLAFSACQPRAEDPTAALGLWLDFSAEVLTLALERLRRRDLEIGQRAFLEEYLASSLAIYRQTRASLRRDTSGVRLVADTGGPGYSDVRRKALVLDASDMVERLPGRPALVFYDLDRHGDSLRPLLAPLFSGRPDLVALLAPCLDRDRDPVNLFARALGHEWLLALYPPEKPDTLPTLVLALALGDEGDVQRAGEGLQFLSRGIGIHPEFRDGRFMLSRPVSASSEVFLSLERLPGHLILKAGDATPFRFSDPPRPARQLVRRLARMDLSLAGFFRTWDACRRIGLPLPTDTPIVLETLRDLLPTGVFQLEIASTPDALHIDLAYRKEGAAQ